MSVSIDPRNTGELLAVGHGKLYEIKVMIGMLEDQFLKSNEESDIVGKINKDTGKIKMFIISA